GHPIFFAVLIVLAVFAPIFTLHGIEGRMFIPLTFAVSSAVFGSLIISLTLTPAISSVFFNYDDKKKGESILIRLIKRCYNPVLNYSLSNIGIVVLITLLALVLVFSVGTEFMPEMDESSLMMNILLPPGTSLEESSRVASLISQKISDVPEVLRVVRRTGRTEGAEHAEPVNVTESNIVLVPKEERKKGIDEIKDNIRKKIEGIPGVSISLVAPLQHRINHVITGTKAAIAVKIFGENINTTSELTDKIYEIISDIPGITDIQKEQIMGVPEYQIRMKREKIARYGLNVKDVSDIIEIALNGKTATELIETHKRYDIFIRYKEDFRKDENRINNILIETPAGFRIPLSELAEVIEENKPAIIRRENAMRRTMVQCNVTGRDLGSVVSEIKDKLSGIDFPEGYFVMFGGTYENQIRAMKQLTFVVIITIVIIFFLLFVSFQSFKSALLIIINIPLALVGGVFILLLTDSTLSVPTLIGFITLMGIAVQDGIVLVSHVNNYQKAGYKVKEALIKAGNNKIRPVLMTTFTTLFGLMPLAIRNVTGSEIQGSLAYVIIVGLLFSTVITLVVLPTLYAAIIKDKNE
ncbi:efflux RND transporter permease subunit, partial [candidate division KSB1 bacterium]